MYVKCIRTYKWSVFNKQNNLVGSLYIYPGEIYKTTKAWNNRYSEAMEACPCE